MPFAPGLRRRVLVVTPAVLLIAVGACGTSTEQRGPTTVAAKTSAATASTTQSTAAAGAQAPLALHQYVTDLAGAFNPAGLNQVEAAIDRLYNDRRIRLWVVFVRDFSRMKPGLSAADNAVAWAQKTMQVSNFGATDAVFAVATEGRAYAIQLATGITSVDKAELDSLLADVKSDLVRRDWLAATLKVADRLNSAAG
jgi:hypothetical protein